VYLKGTFLEPISRHGDALWKSSPVEALAPALNTRGPAIASDGHALGHEKYSMEAHVRCNFGRLIEYLERRLGTEGELEVLEHLEGCQVCFDTICELVRERAAFRALRACPEVRIAAMRRAGTLRAGSGGGPSSHQDPGSEQDLKPGQSLRADGLNVASRTCIRKGRRWTRWA
jgi:hypothetical protein